MQRLTAMFSDWTRDEIVLILGPVLLSAVLVVLYAAGLRPVAWPALLLVVVLVNLAGDIAYAARTERRVKHGSVPLRNDVVGSRAIAGESFNAAGGSYRGAVVLAGARWRAVSDRPVEAGNPLRVTGRRGLVLEVAPDAS